MASAAAILPPGAPLEFVELDELGYLPFVRFGGQLLFQLVGKLHDRTSVIITANLMFGSRGVGPSEMIEALRHRGGSG